MRGQLFRRPRTVQLAAFVAIFALAVLVYLPGINGPWLFDDYGNLLHNSFVRIHDLDLETLSKASYTMAAGPLQRPVAMLSFALNYYFVGSFDNTLPYKLTNLIIHAINGILVFWLARLIFEQRVGLNHSVNNKIWKFGIKKHVWLALAVAALWTAHPIQVSSVLYVVQRMTELATFFMLLSLICYFLARTYFMYHSDRRLLPALLLMASVALWILGMLSKENAAILPVLVLLLEFIFFPKQSPWHYWHKLTPRLKTTIVFLGAALIASAVHYVIQYALPGYGGRPFTMSERLLTETRILFFYLYLILIPQIDQFALYHDDITLSTSLLSPWTTTPAVMGHIVLLLLAIVLLLRRKQPILALGIMWFYIGHAMESTIIPLELVHEHRNYFPGLGIFMVMVEAVRLGARRLKAPKLAWSLPIFIIFFSVITTTRAHQWSSANMFYAFELIHRPHSAMANSGLAGVLAKMGRQDDSENTLRLAAQLQPNESSHLIWLLSAQVQLGKVPEQQIQDQILKLLAVAPLSATTVKTFGDVANCLGTWCGALSKPMQEWLDTLLQRQHNAGDKSYYYYLLGISLANQGKTEEAVDAFWKSHELDTKYLHPLFGLADIYIQLRELANAERVLHLLQESSKNNPHSMPRQVEMITNDIKQLRSLPLLPRGARQ